MSFTSWLSDLRTRVAFSHPKPSPKRQLSHTRSSSGIESLEVRTLLAGATLASGVLTIDFTATGTDAEDVTLTNDGTDLIISGDVTGDTSFTTADVNEIIVTDSGGSSAQSLSFAANTDFDLTDGVSSTGVETLTFNEDLDAGASLDLTATLMELNGAMVTTSGDQEFNGAVTLGVDVTLTSGAAITINGTVDGDQALTIDATNGLTFSNSVDVGELDVTGASVLLDAGSLDFAGIASVPSLTSDSDATLQFDIAGETVDTEYDQLSITGTVTLGDATLQIAHDASFTPTLGTEFVIIDNDEAETVTGTFAGLAEGDLLVSNDVYYQISYLGGTGNDVVLTVVFTGDLIVDNLTDENDGDYSDGDLSLREAIALANLDADVNTITFDNTLAGGSINLVAQATGNRRLEITEDVIITGLGADQLTINGLDVSQIFYIDESTVEFSDFRLINGNANDSDTGLSNGGTLNNTERGGAVFNDRGELTLTDMVITENESLDSGAGAYNFQGTLTVIDSLFSLNLSGDDGGGIYNNGTLNVSGSAFIENEAQGDDGGGVHNSIGDVAILDSLFQGNSAIDSGGGFLNQTGTAFISGSTFTENEADFGGGLSNEDDLTIINSTFSGNAAVIGGGVESFEGSTVIVNSTIVDNIGADFGGGVAAGFDATTTLINSIVAGNFSGILDPDTPNDIDGNDLEAESSNNIIGDADTSGGLSDGVDGNIVGIDVTLVVDTTLADNGGPTPTHALAFGSPALNAGDSTLATDDGTLAGTALTTDQRGSDRIVGAAVDIGAFEAPARPEAIIGRNSDTGDWLHNRVNDGGNAFEMTTPVNWSSSETWVDVVTGDFNGDGLEDFAGRIQSSGEWWVSVSDGSSFTHTQWGNWSSSVTWVDVMAGDFNGDGLTDIAGRVQSSGSWWVAVSDDSSFSNVAWGNWSSSATWVDVMTGDFNGDGLTDIAGRVQSSGTWWIAVSDGNSFTNAAWERWSQSATWVDVMTDDFNRDGLTDIAGRVQSSGQWWVAVSDASEFTSQNWGEWSTSVIWIDVVTGDFNNDGRTDIAGRAQSSGAWWIAVSGGTSFSNEAWSNWSTAATWTDVVSGDFDGDGKTDLAGRVQSSGNWWVALSDGSSFSNQNWGNWDSSATWLDASVGEFGI